MLQSKILMEVKKGERLYQLLLPADCPLGEVHDVVHEMKCFVVQKIEEYNAKEKEAQEAKENQPEKVVDITQG